MFACLIYVYSLESLKAGSTFACSKIGRRKLNLLLKFLRSLLEPRKPLLKVAGLHRFLIAADFDPRILRYLSVAEKEMLLLLITECGFPLNRSLFKRYCSHLDTLVRIDGFVFVTQDFEDLYHALLYHEKSTLGFLMKSFRKNGVFVDVGANIGGFAVRLGSLGRVFAIEPDQRNHALLKQNIGINNLTNIVTYNVAASDQIGREFLSGSLFHGRYSILGGGNKTVVNSVTLDYLLKAEDIVDIIKIDVEGAEHLVLQGALDTLVKTKLLILEISDPSKVKFFSAFLSRFGFHFTCKYDANSVFEKA
jgi:FkbM family methyltransferase